MQTIKREARISPGSTHAVRRKLSCHTPCPSFFSILCLPPCFTLSFFVFLPSSPCLVSHYLFYFLPFSWLVFHLSLYPLHVTYCFNPLISLPFSLFHHPSIASSLLPFFSSTHSLHLPFPLLFFLPPSLCLLFLFTFPCVLLHSLLSWHLLPFFPLLPPSLSLLSDWSIGTQETGRALIKKTFSYLLSVPPRATCCAFVPVCSRW